MRKFEKISFEQFKKDIKDDRVLYDSYRLPSRDTKASAGYDIYLIEDISLKPGEIKKIPTGLKACFNSDEVLFFIVRSSMGFKHNIRLTNQVGVIDADYYNNIDNEGHMWISIQNESDIKKEFTKGEAIAQGIFMRYLTIDDDKFENSSRRSDY